MATYEMHESNLPNDEGKRTLYPRMRLAGQDSLEDLAGRISRISTFSAGDIKGLVKALVEEMAVSMSQGRSVKIEKLGIFTPSLGLRKGAERETGREGERRRNAASICVSGIRFKPGKALLEETDRRCELRRAERKFERSSQQYTLQQRRQLALEHLEHHPFLTVGDYCDLTGLLHTTAANELRRWREEEGSAIGVRGTGTHRVYVKRARG